MRQPTRRLTAIFVTSAALLTFAACKPKDTAAVADTAAASVASAATAGNAGATDAQVASAEQSLATYALTSENVAKVAQVMRTMQSLEKSDPALKAEWTKYGPKDNPKTVDEAVDRMNNAPRGPEILKSAGISAHDYVYTTFALLYASIAYEMKKAGQPTASPKLATSLNPANVEFVATHQKEIAAVSALNSASGSGDEH